MPAIQSVEKCVAELNARGYELTKLQSASEHTICTELDGTIWGYPKDMHWFAPGEEIYSLPVACLNAMSLDWEIRTGFRSVEPIEIDGVIETREIAALVAAKETKLPEGSELLNFIRSSCLQIWS